MIINNNNDTCSIQNDNRNVHIPKGTIKGVNESSSLIFQSKQRDYKDRC